MQRINSKCNPEFYILVDHYPYTESRKLISEQFQSWFEFKKNQNIDIINYSLNDDSDPNTLGFSFNNRLRNGNFCFLYRGDACLCFAGLMIRYDNAWIHRLFTNPGEYIQHLGTISQYLLPYQIKIAREAGCKYYKLTYHGRNHRFYYFYRDKKYLKSKFYTPETLSGVMRISKFEFVGEQIINMTPQLVAQLDLHRSDIEEFCVF
jgi:hypothetical protein